jgi:hypothetical protein
MEEGRKGFRRIPCPPRVVSPGRHHEQDAADVFLHPAHRVVDEVLVHVYPGPPPKKKENEEETERPLSAWRARTNAIRHRFTMKKK